MPKFRKKPVEIEAVQWTGKNAFSIMSFVGQQLECQVPSEEMERDHDDIPPEAYTIFIPTLEGDMRATKGDYIIKGVKGEFYPCKPDVFADTYEKVYEDVRFALGSSIEDVVNLLLSYKRRGVWACGMFNDVRLESDTVTMDSAYIAITGKTKSEWSNDRVEEGNNQ